MNDFPSEVETALIPIVYRVSLDFGFYPVCGCKHVLDRGELLKHLWNVKRVYIQPNMIYLSAHKILGR